MRSEDRVVSVSRLFFKHMDWEKYSRDFSTAAELNGFDERYVGRCLEYASRLVAQNLPIVYSLDHLAGLVGFDESYIRFVAYRPNAFYRTFTIPKKSGGEREISEPLPNLKQIQRWILDSILYRIRPSPYAKGFVPEKSIRENARFHRNQAMVLSLDIKNFFPSLSPALVRVMFRSFGYSPKVTYFLTRLCTLDGALPQGAPTSPALSNIIFAPVDKAIGTYCMENGLRYTRYADDLTFSGEFEVGALIRYVRNAIGVLHLKLNEVKTRLMRRHERQEVTGITVNQKLQAPRTLRRDLRQALFYIEKFGFENHIARLHERRANYGAHLLGLATFVLFINPRDRDALRAVEIIRASTVIDS